MACKQVNLNEYLIIEHEVRTPDAGGGHEKVWQELEACWGAVKAVRSDEKYQAGSRDVRTVMFTIYYRDDVTADMRIVWENRHFEIDDIRTEGPQRQFMTIVGISGLDRS